MDRTLQLIQQLRKDRVPFNVVTIEDERLIRHLFGLPDPAITFNPNHDPNKLNLVIHISKEEAKQILKHRPNLNTILLTNEYTTLSELNILTRQKQLLPAADDHQTITPAEHQALNGEVDLPAHLLRENLRAQCKLPASRAARITGKYISPEPLDE
ncbi:hypothetical protein NEHOM01_1317 [Nematocida homosporus]|uniref:uncharacterized protein n=1 Tax=Nematocida homosporus TaxID=1912981 RepID=UPI002220AD0A|nr:uncharacterized protein NEHOM01_1317 [Nematocida homosporus]KAI5186152.1 hypothetical protein NEHOM01_1317 [Nematocida homosporus]